MPYRWNIRENSLLVKKSKQFREHGSISIIIVDRYSGCEQTPISWYLRCHIFPTKIKLWDIFDNAMLITCQHLLQFGLILLYFPNLQVLFGVRQGWLFSNLFPEILSNPHQAELQQLLRVSCTQIVEASERQLHSNSAARSMCLWWQLWFWFSTTSNLKLCSAPNVTMARKD